MVGYMHLTSYTTARRYWQRSETAGWYYLTSFIRRSFGRHSGTKCPSPHRLGRAACAKCPQIDLERARVKDVFHGSRLEYAACATVMLLQTSLGNYCSRVRSRPAEDVSDVHKHRQTNYSCSQRHKEGRFRSLAHFNTPVCNSRIALQVRNKL